MIKLFFPLGILRLPRRGGPSWLVFGLCLWLLAGLPAAVAATLPDSVRRAPTDSLLLAQCPGYEQVRVTSIVFVGHEVTKERTLRAELDFREGDPLPTAGLARRLEANRRRLFNLRLFHAVTAQLVCRGGEVTVLFAVQERWYTFPVPIFSLADRNFRSWLDRPDRWQRLDYGLHLTRENFRGRNEQLLGNLQLGFNRKYELFYEAPGYGRRRRVGFGAGASYYRGRGLDYATANDRLVNFRPVAGAAITRQYATAGIRWRRTVQHLTAFDVAYHHEQVADSVILLNPAYYLGGARREFVDFTLSTTLNKRNTFAYPLTGGLVQLTLVHRAFLTAGSPAITTLRAQAARYLDLGRGFYYNVGVRGQARLAARVAYADNRALGFDVLVRGYDPYVVDGRYFGLAQQSVSYRLFDAGRLHVQGIQNPKINRIPLAFYLNIFADAGYVTDRHPARANALPRQLLASTGVGLHLVTYYDRVLTVEYARTLRGTGGFFFRSAFPI